MKKQLLLAVFILFFAAVCIGGYLLVKMQKFQNESRSLNIILISIDALRADHMGVYGYAKNTTPNIDLWARDAAVFTNADTAAPLTYPSFAALMTGLHPFTSRIISNPDQTKQKAYGLPMNENTITLPLLLRQKGYYTAAFISNRMIDESVNINRGFKLFKVFNWQDEKDKMIDAALGFLEFNKDKKLFTWIHLLDPHAPYEPPGQTPCDFDKAYCDSGISYQSLEAERLLYRKLDCHTYTQIPEDRKKILESLYDGEITFIDRVVKRIFERLKETGLDKNSIVILLSDHGEGMDHEAYFHHGTNVYQSNIRIPLIIKHPLLTMRDKRIDAPVQNVDLLPTLLDLLYVPHINKTDGVSFAPLLQSDKQGWFVSRKEKDKYSVNSTVDKFSIISGNYKYIYNYHSCAFNDYEEELYDLNQDPEEKRNLVAEKKEAATQLKAKLLEHLLRYNLPQDQNNDVLPEDSEEKLLELKSLGY